MMILMSTTSE
jgi:hypothetical protein